MKRLIAVPMLAGAVMLFAQNVDAGEWQAYRLAEDAAAKKTGVQQADDGPGVVVDRTITETDATMVLTDEGYDGFSPTYDTITIASGEIVHVVGAVWANNWRIGSGVILLLESSESWPSVIGVAESGSFEVLAGDGLVQILGQGPETETFGLQLHKRTRAVLRNTVIANNQRGLVVDIQYSEQNLELRAEMASDQLYLVDNKLQLMHGFGAVIHLNNSVVWNSNPPESVCSTCSFDNTGVNLGLPVEFRATNSRFRDAIYTTSHVSEDELGAIPNPVGLTFLDCPFTEPFMGELGNARSDLHGRLSVLETRPSLAGTRTVDVLEMRRWSQDFAPADFTGNEAVDAEDVELLARAFGSPKDSIPFGNYYDLDSSGEVDIGDLNRIFEPYTGSSPTESVTTLVENPLVGQFFTTISSYDNAAAAVREDSVLGPIMERVFNVPTAVAEVGAETPNEFGLGQNYPNPFNASTTIMFALSETGDIILTVFDLAGQQVATLAAGHYAAGTYIQQWDGLNEHGQPVASGVYVYRLHAGAYTKTNRMTLLR